MEKDGSRPAGVVAMVALTEKEARELLLAVKARARMSGSGTESHRICNQIVEKLFDSQSGNGRGSNGKVSWPTKEQTSSWKGV